MIAVSEVTASGHCAETARTMHGIVVACWFRFGRPFLFVHFLSDEQKKMDTKRIPVGESPYFSIYVAPPELEIHL